MHGGLPHDPTTFVGREAELAEIRTALDESPLVTLVGPGGVGKTRLALRAGLELTPQFADGVVFVDLAAVAAGDGVGAAVAAAVGVREVPAGSPLDAAAAHLLGRTCLLVVDNCEQVAEACAVACDRLATEGDSRVLATSRVPLRARAEVLVLVAPLALPDGTTAIEDSPAVRLFIDRARRVRRPFTLGSADAASVEAVCRQLDGLPLAIELAAARVGALGLGDLARELAASRSLLSDAGPGRPDRHRDMEACVAWSFGLLTDTERELALRLSVFAGGFDAEAVRAVCTDSACVTDESALSLLADLVDASIVAFDHGADDRYRMLDTIRHHAAAQLQDTDRWRRRHCDWAASIADRVAAAHGVDDGAAHRLFSRERDNLFTASAWSARGDPESGMRILGTLWLVFNDYGVYDEVRRAGNALLDAAPDAAPDARIGVLLALLSAANGSGDLDLAVALSEEIAAVADELGDDRAKAYALTVGGYARLGRHDADATDHLRIAVELASASGDDPLLADALVGYGFHRALTGELPLGVADLERAVDLAGHRGTWVVPAALSFLGSARLLAADVEGAIRAFDDALAAGDARPMGSHFFFTPFATSMRAIAMALHGDAGDARRFVDELQRSTRDQPHPVVRSVVDVGVATVAHWEGDDDAAVDAYMTSLAYALDPFWASWARFALAELALAAGDLADARRHASVIARDVNRYGHTHHRTRLDQLHGRIAQHEGDLAEAVARQSAALAAAVDGSLLLVAIDALDDLAGLASLRGEADLAAVLVGAADGQRARTGYVRTPSNERRLVGDLESARTLLGDETFEQHRGAATSATLDDVLTRALAGRGARRRAALGWDSLTPAERNVVRLVAEGLSNAEIGERLYISRRTVDRHLSNIFTKTGLTSRTQVAAEAIRRA